MSGPARRPGWPTWPPRPGPAAGGGRPRRALRVTLLCTLAVVLGLVALGAGGVWWGTNHYGDRVARIPDAFPDGPRPQDRQDDTDVTTFLLAGVDRRSEKPTTGTRAAAGLWKPGVQRSDTLMLVRLDADAGEARTVSIPRDSWVQVPGHGRAKVNEAFARGGPPLLVETVERLTGIRVDHFGVVDWHGFRALTDAVGGVPITVRENAYDPQQDRHFAAGTHTMDGEEALAYVRQRHGLPGHELDRIERQQQFLRSLVGEMRGEVGVADPVAMDRMLNAVTGAVSVDADLSNSDLRDFVLDLRRLDTENVEFTTAPIERSEMIHGQYALLLDEDECRKLWHAVETGEPLGAER